MITIRKEAPDDADGIRRVNEEAFGRPGEANLVDALRRRFVRPVSLVALEEERIIGHPDYYPCFGFQPAHLFGIRCEFDVPEEAFAAMPLSEGALANCGGIVKYPPEFRDV